MRVRVEHEMMNNIVKTTSNDYENLFKEITAIQNDINSLKNVWRGTAADIFYARIDNYLENLKTVPETYNTFAKFISKANGLYKEVDENLCKEIKEIRNGAL